VSDPLAPAPPVPLTSLHRQREVWVSVRGPSFGLAGQEGWYLSPYLRCEQITYQAGAAAGQATFTYVPQSDVSRPFEHAWQQFNCDQQVRVEVAGEDPVQPRIVLFEGVLNRQAAAVSGDALRSGEQVTLVADAMPALENRLDGAIIGGRWAPIQSVWNQAYYVHVGYSTYWIYEGGAPAVFNANGRPNRHATQTLSAARVTPFLAPVWTHDDDPNGKHWTLGDALVSLLAAWLHGPAASPRDRASDSHAVLLGAYNGTFALAGTSYAQAYQGLDQVLPPTDVTGLGVFSALDKVCAACGYGFAVQFRLWDGVTAWDQDRRWVAIAYRKGHGRPSSLRLDDRGSTYSSPDAALQANYNHQINLIRSSAEVVNEVYAYGRTHIEYFWPLKPLWSPGEEAAGALGTQDMQDVEEEDLQVEGSYASRHVEGGSEFSRYGHVGRVWGIDCTGEWAPTWAGTPYSHVYGNGFPFVEYANLNAQDNPIRQARLAAGITGSMQWMPRMRRFLPLRHPTALAEGVQFILAVSEAGSIYAAAPIRFEVLRDRCGIRLHVRNLASVNLRTFRTDPPEEPPANQSWWYRMKMRNLLFTLYARVEGDHAWLERAPRLAAGAVSAHTFTRHVWSDVEDTWVHPQAAFNALGAWQRFAGDGRTSDGAAALVNLTALAQRTRDSQHHLRLSGNASAWLPLWDQWRVGDACTAVKKRDVTLTSGPASSQPPAPDIVRVQITLGAGKQGIQITLSDAGMAGGRA